MKKFLPGMRPGVSATSDRQAGRVAPRAPTAECSNNGARGATRPTNSQPALATFTLVLAFFFAAILARAEETNSVPKTDFKYFKIISERNIFNPKRTKYVPPSPKPKPVKIETFTFVGALGSENGRVVFFDSGSSEFRKALKPGESIAGMKIIAIDFQRVKLFLENGKTIELPIGAQMKRQDEGEWFVNSSPEPMTKSDDAKSEKPKAAAKSDGGSAGGSEEDILKKLMQQREQELNK